MDPKTAELINFSPLVELFGTFFEKLTNKHSHKDQLRKELAEFKCVLYTNQQNATNVDTYLDTLNKNSIIPPQNSSHQQETSSHERKNTLLSPNTISENSAKTKVTTSNNKKVEILPMADFLRYRSIAQADKKQVLVTHYGHVQSLEKNPNNLYRTLGIYLFTLMLKSSSSSSEKHLSEIIDEIAAKRIQLSCPAENLSHDDMCGVFCGFFSQLLRMKRSHEPFLTVIQTFHDMVGAEKTFSTAIASFIKFKIYSLIEQKNFPYELISLRAIAQSKAFKEKIENNDYSILDTLLRIVPFVFNRQVVLNLFENGKLSEIIYKGPKPKKQNDGQVLAQEYDDRNTIHLLVEKVFLTVSVFGLFTTTSTPFTVQAKSPIRTESANVILNREVSLKPTLTDSPTITKKAPRVRTLTIDTTINSEQNIDNKRYWGNTPSLNRISLQENTSKYAVSSARGSYQPTYAKTLFINSNNDISYPIKEENTTPSNAEGDTGNTKKTANNDSSTNEKENENGASLYRSPSPKRVSTRYEPRYLARRELNHQDSTHNKSFDEKQLTSISRGTIPSSVNEITTYLTSPSSNGLINRASSPIAVNKLYQPRNTHVKAHSINSINPRSATLSSGSGSNQHSEESTPQGLNKTQNDRFGVTRTEPSVYYHKSAFADKRNTSTADPQQSVDGNTTVQRTTELTTEQDTSSLTQIKTTDGVRSASKAATTNYTTSSLQSKEKLKNIVTMTPKSVIHLASNSLSINSTSSPTYPRPTYVSKYANNTSYNNRYQSPSTTVHLEESDSSKQLNKYQINSSYQGRISSPARYRPSYTPLTNNSQNNSFNKETVPSYRAYNNRSISTYQTIGDYSSPVKYTPGDYSRSKNNSTALSTNTSFNGNPYSTLQTGQPRLTIIVETTPRNVAEQQS